MIESRIRLLDLSSITLPASRQRSKISYDKVLEYAISIAQHGVLQEPGVREEGLVLTWGGHRYNSFCLLRALKTGESTELTAHYKSEQLDELRALLPSASKHYEHWSKIPVKLIRGASPLLLEVLELAENLNRDELPWQDKAAAVEAVHRQATADAKTRNESWTDADTARLLGLDRRTATLYLTPQRKLEAITDPEIKAKAAAAIKQSSSARSAITSAETIATRYGVDTSPHAQVKKLLCKGKELEKPTAPATPAITSPILCADFHEWAAAYDGLKFNFLHCDFPYGVDFNSAVGQNTSAATRDVGKYDDGEEVYWALLSTLLLNRDKLLEPSTHIMFWLSVGMSKTQEVSMHRATTKEITTWWPDAHISSVPLIWHCSDNSGLMPDPKREPRRTYEWALKITLGDRPLAKSVAASFAYPRNSDDKLHRSQKHEAVLKHFFQLFVDSSTRMLDPTCGSGTSILTAHKMGAASVLGLELDPDMAAMAQRHFEETIK